MHKSESVSNWMHEITGAGSELENRPTGFIRPDYLAGPLIHCIGQ